MKKKNKKIILFNCNIVTEFEVLVKKAIVISNNIIDEIIDERVKKREGKSIGQCI